MSSPPSSTPRQATGYRSDSACRTSPPPSRAVRVLLVEDDLPTVHALEMLLRHHGFDVIVAPTVDAALQSLVADEPDAVLLDLMLPDGDGVRILQAIRDRRLPTRVAVLTGVGDGERLDHVRALGPDALLQKPVDFVQILEHLPAA